MHGCVEFFQAFRGIRQFGNPEQRSLQAFATLALQNLLAQHAVRLAQRGRAVSHPTAQFDVRFAPFERGLHMLRNVIQQFEIVPRVVRVGAIALHHDAADDLAAA
jgi:hypothetical protein